MLLIGSRPAVLMQRPHVARSLESFGRCRILEVIHPPNNQVSSRLGGHRPRLFMCYPNDEQISAHGIAYGSSPALGEKAERHRERPSL